MHTYRLEPLRSGGFWVNDGRENGVGTSWGEAKIEAELMVWQSPVFPLNSDLLFFSVLDALLRNSEFCKGEQG